MDPRLLFYVVTGATMYTRSTILKVYFLAMDINITMALNQNGVMDGVPRENKHECRSLQPEYS